MQSWGTCDPATTAMPMGRKRLGKAKRPIAALPWMASWAAGWGAEAGAWSGPVRSGHGVVASARSAELDLTRRLTASACGVASLAGVAHLLDLGPGHDGEQSRGKWRGRCPISRQDTRSLGRPQWSGDLRRRFGGERRAADAREERA